MESSIWYVIGRYMTNLLESVSKLEFDHTKRFAKLKQNDVIAKLNSVNERILKERLIVPEQVCRSLEWCTKFYLILKQCELSMCDLSFSDVLPLLRENSDGYYDQASCDSTTTSDCDSVSSSSIRTTPLANPTVTSCNRSDEERSV